MASKKVFAGWYDSWNGECPKVGDISELQKRGAEGEHTGSKMICTEEEFCMQRRAITVKGTKGGLDTNVSNPKQKVQEGPHNVIFTREILHVAKYTDGGRPEDFGVD